MQIRFEEIQEGYRAYDGPYLLAVITTNQHNSRGLSHGSGAIVWEPMPKSSWSIHWTSPSMPLVQAQAVLQQVPESHSRVAHMV